jgi:sulfate permease, SulP family
VNRSAGAVWHSVARLLPGASDYSGLRRSWRGDLLAGLTVGVVALPLALGFGVASGVGATAGIVTAIVAGIVAAVFGGSSVQVSGPTGAMAVVLVPIVAHYGVGAVATVAIIAGVLVIGMGLSGLGRMIQFVPWPVLEGFTVGIAITIALQQVPLLFGEAKGTGSTVLDSAWLAVRGASWSTSADTLLLGALVVAVMVVWPRVTKRVPSSIMAVVIVTLMATFLKLSVPTIGALPHHLPLPSVPVLSPTAVRHLFGPAVAIAILAAIESLLSARVADAMTGATRTSDTREMVGQGLANIATGFFGGMPATGAIARTAVNVRSGARTRVAAITHSLVIVAVIVLASPVVSRIPLAVLGGVLVMTAVKMVDHIRVLTVIRAHAPEAIVFGLTAAVTIAIDLVTAIEVGLVVAGVLALRAIASGSGATQEELADHHDGPVDETALLSDHIAVFRLDGALFFGAVPRFRERFRRVEGVQVVILRLKGLTFIDASGAEALAQIIDELEGRGITVLIKGARAEHGRILATAGILADLDAKGHLFDDLDAATTHARRHVDRSGLIDGVGAA